MCLFEGCNHPDELYSHSDEWFAHLKQHGQRWRCSSHHDLDPFTTREEYIQHLRTVHNSKLSDAQLRVLANKSTRNAAKLFPSCPLCGKDESQVDGRLEDHIVGHLRSLAIKSLPSYEEDIPDDDGIGKESIDVSRPQSRSTVKDLEDVTFVGFGTNLNFYELESNFEQDETPDTNFLGDTHIYLVPGHANWLTSRVRHLDELMSAEDDPILHSILERQKEKAMVLDDSDQARDTLRRPLIRHGADYLDDSSWDDGSDASETTRNDLLGQDQGPSTSDPDATDPSPTADYAEPHWAEHIFSDPPSSQTEIHGPQRSEAHGPFFSANTGAHGADPGAAIAEGLPSQRLRSLGMQNACKGEMDNANDLEQTQGVLTGPRLPPAARILFRLSFDDDRLNLMAIINAANGGPYLILRVNTEGAPMFSWRGVHELVVHQVGNAVQVKRWSHSTQSPKVWAVLSFANWKGIEVTFSCA